MRTTGLFIPGKNLIDGSDATQEGVWMSVTPTDEILLIALDFEGITYTDCLGIAIYFFLGVHSIERSAQEDTLLVLFNTAVSNLVRKIIS